MDPVATFAEYRGALMGLAYRMLGSMADAEDAVQDAALKWNVVDHATIENPRAFLMTMTSRIAIDKLRAQARSREDYVGPWLPEPVDSAEFDLLGASAAPAPDARYDLSQSLTLALLHVMDQLSPSERAAFLLHDVFDMDYGEIAQSLDKSESACRKLVSRARTHIQDAAPPTEAALDDHKPLIEAFFAASSSGNMDGLMAMMAPDVRLISDGGGKARASYRPLHGPFDVATVMASVGVKTASYPDLVFEWRNLNGMPSVVLKSKKTGQIHSATAFSISGGIIRAIYMMRNPDKLAHIQAVILQS